MKFFIAALLFPTWVFSAEVVPACIAYNHPIPVNNSQVLHWKRTTSNQFQERGHIQGTLSVVYPDRNGHKHMQVQIGHALSASTFLNSEDVIEVIYNEDFGKLPKLQTGMVVEACGDYITSTAQSGPYPPSPDGAIVHWVHMNPSHVGHPAGYLVLDGVIYGQNVAGAGKKRRR